MKAFVRRLSEVCMTDAGLVGGKAASLGDLIASGIRVPNGLAVAPSSDALTAEERAALEAALRQIPGTRFAVRSSGVEEDGAERSYAGMFESVLDVPGDEVTAAVDRVLDSAAKGRVGSYDGGSSHRMAVIVQPLVDASSAGVALTADPVTGDRQTTIVTVVRGLGERLVSGEVMGDEWLVRDGKALRRRATEDAVGSRDALRIAAEAGRIANMRAAPQDVEWAIDQTGELWILQARPMTALPAEASWDAPAPGAYTRQLRFGEWIAGPVTPLFESWLLTAMEEGFHARLYALVGQKAPRPFHVIVNGWYFYSIGWLLPGAWLRNLPRLAWHAVRTPRVVAGIAPPTVRYSIALSEREWREEVRPRYRAAVADAEARIETLPAAELPALIDRLADLAAEYFTSVAAFAGSAYKMEMNLAGFYRRHLGRTLGGSHLPLLAGFDLPASAGRYVVTSLDWYEPLVEADAPAPRNHDRVIATRRAAEQAAFEALAPFPRRLRAFRNLLAETQRLVPIREEHVAELTLAWPVMRRAVLRIGEALAERGCIASAEDAFFLTRAELLAALQGAPDVRSTDVARRRALRAEQAKLVAPMLVGNKKGLAMRMLGMLPRMVGAAPSSNAIVSGAPASPGRASGTVRIVRGPADFDALQAGEILVAPLTAPAWTPLFARAAAVVTDVGSAASHASIIAREYGIPAIVGCGDATARLGDGMRVTVDGTTGNVEPA